MIRLGILGGVSPVATGYLYREILMRTYAISGQYLETICYSIPLSSDLEKAMINCSYSSEDSREMGALLKKGIQILKGMDVDDIVLPCNTLGAFFTEDAVGNCTSPVDKVVARIASQGFDRVGLLATNTTLSLGTYQRALAAHNIECVVEPEFDGAITSLIHNSLRKPHSPSLQLIQDITERWSSQVQAIVLACTDLHGLADPLEDRGFSVFNSLEILIEDIIAQYEKEGVTRV